MAVQFSIHTPGRHSRLWMGSNFSNGCRLQETAEHSKYLEASSEDMGIADLAPLDNPTVNKYLDDIKDVVASALLRLSGRQGD